MGAKDDGDNSRGAIAGIWIRINSYMQAMLKKVSEQILQHPQMPKIHHNHEVL